MKLKQEFESKLSKELAKTLGIKNISAVPKVEAISINVGIGSMMQNSKDYSKVENNLAIITGQKPRLRKARKSISNFKLREGMPVGLSVTLRGERMYDFINKLVNIVMPRIRDFRGISKKSFDNQGNYSIGITEHTVFPEINPDDIVTPHGIQISVKTTTNDKEQAYELLKLLGFPFVEAKKSN